MTKLASIFGLHYARNLHISPSPRRYASTSPVVIRPYRLVMLNNCFLGGNVTHVPIRKRRKVLS